MELQLQRLRKEAGLSQKEMADKLGLKVRTYGSWERGEVSLSFPQAIACAEALGCTTDALAGRKIKSPYADRRQRAINASFEGLTNQGKDAALSSVQGILAGESRRELGEEGPPSYMDSA